MLQRLPVTREELLAVLTQVHSGRRGGIRPVAHQTFPQNAVAAREIEAVNYHTVAESPGDRILQKIFNERAACCLAQLLRRDVIPLAIAQVPGDPKGKLRFPAISISQLQ